MSYSSQKLPDQNRAFPSGKTEGKDGPTLSHLRLKLVKILVSISRQFTSTIFCVVTPVIEIYFCSASYNQLQFSGIKNRDKPGVYNLEQKTLISFRLDIKQMQCLVNLWIWWPALYSDEVCMLTANFYSSADKSMLFFRDPADILSCKQWWHMRFDLNEITQVTGHNVCRTFFIDTFLLTGDFDSQIKTGFVIGQFISYLFCTGIWPQLCRNDPRSSSTKDAAEVHFLHYMKPKALTACSIHREKKLVSHMHTSVNCMESLSQPFSTGRGRPGLFRYKATLAGFTSSKCQRMTAWSQQLPVLFCLSIICCSIFQGCHSSSSFHSARQPSNSIMQLPGQDTCLNMISKGCKNRWLHGLVNKATGFHPVFGSPCSSSARKMFSDPGLQQR